jgi:hypothetical protein
MNEPLVLIAFGGGFIALTLAQLAEAENRAREIMPSPSAQAATLAEEVATAEQMAERTSTPASWWLEAARKGTVPHLRIGKYPRFVVREALEALHTDRRSVARLQSQINQRPARGRYRGATNPHGSANA